MLEIACERRCEKIMERRDGGEIAPAVANLVISCEGVGVPGFEDDWVVVGGMRVERPCG